MEIDFQSWALQRWEQFKSTVQVVNENGEIDIEKLNHVLASFAPQFAWMVTIHEIEQNTLAKQEVEYETWRKVSYVNAERKLREAYGGGQAPTVKAIEARITVDNAEDEKRWSAMLADTKGRCSVLSGYLKALERMATMLQTLSNNLRNELTYAAGVPLGKDKTEQAKSALKASMQESNR